MKRLTLLALVCALAACQRPAATIVAEIDASWPTDSTQVVATIDSAVADLLDEPVAGVAIALSKNGKVLFRRAYGSKDVERRTPLTLADPHQIGSLTKQFTAAAVLLLVEEGRIALDDPIQKYLPDFDTGGRTVTIHHLLNHTSGIRSYTGIFGMNPVPREVILDSIQKHAFDFEPGQEYRYNNSGYYLLGMVLEAATGVPYARYLEDRIFQPLGLASTSYCGFAGREVPVGYARREDSLEKSVLSDMEYPGAAGGICATAEDLLVWQRALVSGQVVSPESYARMTTPAPLASGRPTDYGYGLEVGRLPGHERVEHGGGIPGYNTFLSYYPDDQIGIVVLVNTAPGFATQTEEAIARAVLRIPRPVEGVTP